MNAAIIKLLVVALFGIVVGGGVYLVLFIMELRDERATRAADIAEEVAAGTRDAGTAPD